MDGSGATTVEGPGAAAATGRTGRPRDERASRAIADAALRQLAELGYANMSMESVAAEAGVARATIYRRYQDKADLVTSSIATAAATLRSPTAAREPLAALVAALEEFDARFAEPCLEIVGALLGTRADPSAMARHRARVVGPRKAAVVALVVAAKDAGLLRADADPELLVEMLVGAILARRVIGNAPDPGWARRAVEAACDGVATPAGVARLRVLSASARRARPVSR
jgi:AcrR family transcriptional regulator